ncbi:MAG: hypothetical protein ABSG37_14615, partial [Candidatus Limnocylindrales bacterium]
MKHRVPVLAAAVALVALAIPLIAGVAFATPTTVQPAAVVTPAPTLSSCATPTPTPTIFRPRPTPTRNPTGG